VSADLRHELLWIAKRVHDPMPLSKFHAEIVERVVRAAADVIDEPAYAPAPLACRRVGTWWIVRGRHGAGFHRFDGLNMTEAEAQAQAQRLLPTITDDQVTAMYEMMTGGEA